ncbi:MAG: dihydrodipicolinate synthase family protein [Halioglobus sp.]|nr:dihydrodipicolinate synthase family protein [Halioglobus sp.]
MTVKREHRKEWAADSLRGIENATMPSFTPDLANLDEEGIRWDVRYAIAQGFFSTMCTCEVGLTLEENKRFLEIVCDEAAGKILVSFTLMFDTMEENLEMLAHAEKVGASHALMAYPQTFRPDTPDDIVTASRRMSESTNLGLVLYATDKFDFVRFHPSHVPFEAYDEIANFPNVVSMKVGFGDPAMTFECFERFGDRVQVNVGTPWLMGLFPLLQRRYGAQWFGGGSWEVWQSPERPWLVEYYNHVMKGETTKAREIYWKIAPANIMANREGIARGGDIGMYHWPMGKYISWSVGGNGGLTRQPAMRLTAEQMQGRRMALRAIGIEPRDNDEEFFIGRARHERIQRDS